MQVRFSLRGAAPSRHRAGALGADAQHNEEERGHEGEAGGQCLDRVKGERRQGALGDGREATLALSEAFYDAMDAHEPELAKLHELDEHGKYVHVVSATEGTVSVPGCPDLVLDVVPGRGGGFSLETPHGLRFLSRGRAFTAAENELLATAAPLTGADYERGVRPPERAGLVVAQAADACTIPGRRAEVVEP